MNCGTMSAKRTLIDTSVWIDYFRGTSTALSKKVDDVLSNDEVYVPKIVIAELIQGSKSQHEISVIEDFVNAFHVIDQEDDTWIKSGMLFFKLKKKGKTAHLADCYIAVIAQEHECRILTLDKHFKDIQKIFKVSLVAHNFVSMIEK